MVFGVGHLFFLVSLSLYLLFKGKGISSTFFFISFFSAVNVRDSLAELISFSALGQGTATTPTAYPGRNECC